MDGLVRNTKRRFWWDASLSFSSSGVQIIDFDGNKKYTTALFLHVIGGEKLKTSEYQKWVTDELEFMGLDHLKAVCFSPFEKVRRNGVRTREKAPCFITSITTHEALNSAWKKIKDSHYWKKDKETA